MNIASFIIISSKILLTLPVAVTPKPALYLSFLKMKTIIVLPFCNIPITVRSLIWRLKLNWEIGDE